MKSWSIQSRLDQVFQYSIKESDVATGVDLEEIVGNLGAEQSALVTEGIQYRSSPGSR